MYDLPNECPQTISHAMTHLSIAAGTAGDGEQFRHDLDMAYQIISNIIEGYDAALLEQEQKDGR